MKEKRKRRRWTIASTMMGIAALSLVIMFFLPVLRQGRPDCMTTYTTIRWLASKPGYASCTSCHSATRLVDHRASLLPPRTAAGPVTEIKPPASGRIGPWNLATATPKCPAGDIPNRASCHTCHAN